MLLLKCLHFFGSAAFACSYLYTSLFYFEYFGLSKDVIGLILALNPLVSLIAIPITIHYSHNLKWTGILITMLGILVWSLHWVVKDHIVIWLVAITVGSALTSSSIGTVLDSITFALLPDKDQYGQQRLFGSLSWGLSSLVTGYLIDHYNDIWMTFYLYFLFMGTFLILLFLVPSLHVPKADDESEEQPLLATPVTLFESLAQSHVILFFAMVSLLGLVYSVIGCYLFIYLTTIWHASSALLGATTPFSVFCELPAFYFSPWLLKKMGSTQMILIAHAAFLLRLGLYIALPMVLDLPKDSFVCLFVETLHGLTFGLSWSAGMAIVQKLAPPRYQKTYIGIYCSLSNNAGGALGNLVGGWLFEQFGHVVLWSASAGIIALSCLCFLGSLWTFPCNDEPESSP